MALSRGRSTIRRHKVKRFANRRYRLLTAHSVDGRRRGWGNVGRGDRITESNICPSATLFTTNPTCTGLLPSPNLHGERPATDRLHLQQHDGS